MSGFTYVGSELDLFATARRWKAYWSSQIGPFIRGRVLEVGPGIGSNTVELYDAGRHDWTCLEPDATLAARLRRVMSATSVTAAVRVEVGTTRDLPPVPTFDSILYIDVLEHIEDDRDELRRAAGLLRPAGHLIVLAPAHQQLYSAFDKAIGHFRRYSRRTLLSVAPPTMLVQRAMYLDALGLVASTVNRFALRQSLPTAAQIGFWDRAIVPASRVIDRMIGFNCGKSVVVIWTKPA